MFVSKQTVATASLASLIALSGLLGGCGSSDSTTAAPATTATLLYTSDAHYGIKRAAAYAFNGYSNAQQVNSAMVTVMNGMPTVALPNDGGVKAGSTIGTVDYVIQGGDIANRMQADPAGNGYALVQSAYDSWKQFESGYINTLKFPTLMFPGNHDVSNAIGYYDYTGASASKVLNNGNGGKTDGSVLAFIYNTFVKAGSFDTSTKTAAQNSYTNSTYQTAANKIYYSKDIAGVHFMFISMWPDLDAQAWMEGDLAKLSSTTPAVIFTHDEPVTETKHLTDPVTGATAFSSSKYENLLVNVSAFATTGTAGANTNDAQRTFVRFLQRHKNIVAYFHGNTNYNQFYTYTGPDNLVSLPVFRVDSPMKGMVSGTDATTTTVNPACDATGVTPETSAACVNTDKLSYQVISIDSVAKKMTVREYLWKTKAWGTTTPGNVDLVPRVK
jgi:hypothetical protein